MSINEKELEINFLNYVNEYINEATISDLKTEQDKIGGYIDKRDHSIFVRDSSIKAAGNFDLNKGYREIISASALLHDIARFQQLKLTGTFRDNESYPEHLKTGYDHGDHGYDLLIKENLIRFFIKEALFDSIIAKTVKEHSKQTNKLNLDIKPSMFKVIKENDAVSLVKHGDAVDVISFANLNTRIIQDVDKLDIYRKIVNHSWIPLLTNYHISEEIYHEFFTGKLKSMQDYKNLGTWDANVGHLVRLNFLNDINLLSVVKMIKDESLVAKMYDVYKHPENLDPALRNEKIEGSVDKVSRGYEFAMDFIERICQDITEDGLMIDTKNKEDIIKVLAKKHSKKLY